MGRDIVKHVFNFFEYNATNGASFGLFLQQQARKDATFRILDLDMSRLCLLVFVVPFSDSLVPAALQDDI